MNLSHPLSSHIGGIYGKTCQTGRIKISIQHSDKLRAQLGGVFNKKVRGHTLLHVACSHVGVRGGRISWKQPADIMSITGEGATLSWSYANEMHHE